MINEPKRPDGPGGDGEPLRDKVLSERCPTLLEYLQSVKYGNGKPRQTSTLTIFIERGELKASLNDRDVGRTLWAASDGLAGLLDALEAMLCGEITPWRWKDEDGKNRRRKGPSPA